MLRHSDLLSFYLLKRRRDLILRTIGLKQLYKRVSKHVIINLRNMPIDALNEIASSQGCD